jgi:8-oxo-dGTP pyrophosphatase MutT (NUDIX family)
MPPPTQARFYINILENHQKQIHLHKRSPMAKLGPGLWGFPAGHIQPEETPEQAAHRELTEEIGPGHRLEWPRAIGPVRDSFYGGVYEIHLFYVRWLGGVIRLNGEHTEFAWVGREDYRRYPVMDGIDEDLDYFQIWPRRFLNPDKLPR